MHKGLPSCHCVFGLSVLEHVTEDLVADGYSLSTSSSAGSLLRHPLRTNCLSSTARQYINSFIKVHKGLPSCHCVFGRSVLEHVTKDLVADGYSLSTSSSAGSLLRHPLRTNCLSSTARQYINSFIKVHKGLPSCHCVFGRSVLEHVTKDVVADGYSLSSSSSAGSLLRHPLRTNCLQSTARQYIITYIKVHKGLPSCHCVFGRSVLGHVTKDVVPDGYSLSSSSSAGSLLRHPLRTNCLSSTARQYTNSYIKVHKGLPSCHCVFGRSVLEHVSRDVVADGYSSSSSFSAGSLLRHPLRTNCLSSTARQYINYLSHQGAERSTQLSLRFWSQCARTCD